jgi:hypothetical protein
MNKILPIALVVIVLLVAGYLVKMNKKGPLADNKPINSISLCFYKENKADRGYYDVAWLRMNLSGASVTGEFRNLPAEKDKKVGTFEGTVSPVDKIMMARTADVWWDSMAEGMQVKEQLKIIFGEGTAQAGFGEMVDRGDGVYVYKDSMKITYGASMNDVDCNDIDDIVIVENYLRANMQTIVPDKPVLGGAFYATSIHIDPKTKTGTMMYEDGHVAGSITFSYSRIKEAVTINNLNK